jgi:hypothetical protein
MNDHDHPDQTGGHGGPQGAPGGGGYGYGYGWPSYGFHPGMGPWSGYPPPGPMGPQPGMGPYAGYGPGPMGSPEGYGYGPGPMGPPPGYGEPGRDPAGGGHGPSMDQVVEELSNGGGLGGLGKLLDFDDTEFWKGALVGAAAVLLLTNESLQQSLLKSGVKARDAVEKGLGSMRRGSKAGGGEAADDGNEAAESNKTDKTARSRSTAGKAGEAETGPTTTDRKDSAS